MSEQQKAKWRTIGSLNESKEGNLYFKATEWKNDEYMLLFLDKDGGLYKFPTAALFDPNKEAPNFVQKNIVFNLNDKSVVKVADLNTLLNNS